ncbi:hypothetical protein LO762_15550 [Actinocorallia sp. API 0066]|uniref:hypothetical protein n=1 Tax=Actinocorallia sp. API 0066 TaxID=2896846 RepID=UPI001E43E286|nr:hypothetical protein [Actinocorallia sp. API 0066]MCD0450595.1 hypothetical protein [Actinocorallia sp. API 0066]
MSDEAAHIEAEFPGWRVWRSGTDRWWAYRTSSQPLSIEQLRAGCRLLVQADTPAELRVQIHQEIARAAV